MKTPNYCPNNLYIMIFCFFRTKKAEIEKLFILSGNPNGGQLLLQLETFPLTDLVR